MTCSNVNPTCQMGSSTHPAVKFRVWGTTTFKSQAKLRRGSKPWRQASRHLLLQQMAVAAKTRSSDIPLVTEPRIFSIFA